MSLTWPFRSKAASESAQPDRLPAGDPVPDDRDRLRSLVSRLDDQSRPNLNPLAEAVRLNDILAMNVKTLGYELARLMLATKPALGVTDPEIVRLTSKASTQADMDSRWVAHWCGELQIPLVYHRKIWELAYVLQAIHENGMMMAGKQGLGFGCGLETLPSYLAARDISVTVTDIPPQDRRAAGWASSNEYLAELDKTFHPHLVDRSAFDKNVELRYVDMNHIPTDLIDYDFCWSICALEHLGSIEKGLAFIRNSIATLRPGGLAVHTTEYNFSDEDNTIDNWITVLFQRRHFVEISERLRAEGHDVSPLDLDIGTGILDRFIDVPPFLNDLPTNMMHFAYDVPHLKVSVDGFPSTCFGLIVRKKS